MQLGVLDRGISAVVVGLVDRVCIGLPCSPKTPKPLVQGLEGYDPGSGVLL